MDYETWQTHGLAFLVFLRNDVMQGGKTIDMVAGAPQPLQSAFNALSYRPTT